MIELPKIRTFQPTTRPGGFFVRLTSCNIRKNRDKYLCLWSSKASNVSCSGWETWASDAGDGWYSDAGDGWYTGGSWWRPIVLRFMTWVIIMYFCCFVTTKTVLIWLSCTCKTTHITMAHNFVPFIIVSEGGLSLLLINQPATLLLGTLEVKSV